MKRFLLVVSLLIVAGVGTAALVRYFLREQVIVGSSNPKAGQIPLSQIDHSGWNALLNKYVDDRGLVDYSAWKSSETDRQALRTYLESLSRAEVPPPPAPDAESEEDEQRRAEQFAFWINAYNALTIEGILREYPTDSIRNFTPKFWGYNIWHDLLLPVGDELVSLDDIEHKHLRPLGDFRIHFAIVCASRGCPPLRNEAFDSSRVDEQLTAQARRFLNDPRNFRHFKEGHATFIAWSPLFVWYADDLGLDRATHMHRLSKWIDDEQTRKIAVNPDTIVRRNEYDWGLNDQAQSEPAANEPTAIEAPPAAALPAARSDTPPESTPESDPAPSGEAPRE